MQATYLALFPEPVVKLSSLIGRRKNPLVRFFRFVVVTESCWLWKGARAHGKNSSYSRDYGRFSVNGKLVLPHRWIYEQVVGQIPENYQAHHLCGNADCVCPMHIQPVPQEDNLGFRYSNTTPNPNDIPF